MEIPVVVEIDNGFKKSQEKKIEQEDHKEDDEYPIRLSQNISLQSQTQQQPLPNQKQLQTTAQQPENPEQHKDTEHTMEQKVPTREAQPIQEQPEDQVGQSPPESFPNCKPHKRSSYKNKTQKKTVTPSKQHLVRM